MQQDIFVVSHIYFFPYVHFFVNVRINKFNFGGQRSLQLYAFCMHFFPVFIAAVVSEIKLAY